MLCWCRCLVDCRNILHQLIEPNPELRIPLSELISHAWLTKNDKYPFTTHVPLPRDKQLRNQVGVHVVDSYSTHGHNRSVGITSHLFPFLFISPDFAHFCPILQFYISVLFSGWWIGVHLSFPSVTHPLVLIICLF